jgi:hypothetical protein
MKPVAAKASNVHNSHSELFTNSQNDEDEGLKERKQKQINREQQQWRQSTRQAPQDSRSDSSESAQEYQTAKLINCGELPLGLTVSKGSPNLANIYRITCNLV